MKAASNLQSHATSNVANVSQRAALAALEGDLAAVEEMKAAFDRRRRTIVAMLNEIDGVVCPMPGGAFYAYPSVKGLLGKEYDGRRIDTSADLAEYILDRAEVAVVPGRGVRVARATCACPTHSATTTSSRASRGCRSSSPEGGFRDGCRTTSSTTVEGARFARRP